MHDHGDYGVWTAQETLLIGRGAPEVLGRDCQAHVRNFGYPLSIQQDVGGLDVPTLACTAACTERGFTITAFRHDFLASSPLRPKVTHALALQHT